MFKEQEIAAYIDVILPLALPKLYSYSVPAELAERVQTGVRVEVQFGKTRVYSALVRRVREERPDYEAKPIISVLDAAPIATETQMALWEWMSDYYCCSTGEVMNAALPAGLKLASETRVLLSPIFQDDFTQLTDEEYLIAEALSIQEELSIEDVQSILNRKTIYPLINSLLYKRVIILKEELKTKFKPKQASYIRLTEPYRSDPETLKFAFEKIGNRARKQQETLLAYIQLIREPLDSPDITPKQLCEYGGIKKNHIKELEKKDIFEVYKKEVSRLTPYDDELVGAFELSAQQAKALIEIQANFAEKNTVLLHGVTGSGKTRVYIDLIFEALKENKQVLYLLPEIALTTQIINRLQKIFGNDIAVYHSRLNNNERVEIWHNALIGKPIIVGARSALFLPFKKLDLIIIDEEHDASFKQHDPAPRYNARDTAIYLAHKHGAKVLLGTATPSLESYVNTQIGKYGLVEMSKRFGGLKMPEIVIADVQSETKKKTMQSHFTTVLLDEIKAALERKEQVILFQNRRGYAPTLRCEMCGWTAECIHCDISLTYHKYSNQMRCHLCGYHTKQPPDCPACGNHTFLIQGFGTEKIEDELQIFLPEIRVSRMDWDTVKGKNAHQRIIAQFEDKQIDVLVGTQMVTKGLDFDNVGLVGVMSADSLLFFPDFRATERAFQLMTQVSGRAGRKQKQGKVVIQAMNTSHPVLTEVFYGDFKKFFEREEIERRKFKYPPFYRLIGLQLKHKKKHIVDDAAEFFARELQKKLGSRVLGPSEPGVSRVRSYYVMNILIKLERKKEVIDKTKAWIRAIQVDLSGRKGMSSVRVNVNVDPY